MQTISQGPAAMNSEDDFGLSSGDEAALLDAEQANPLKRKSEAATSSTVKARRVDDATSQSQVIANDVRKNWFNISSFRLKQEAAIERLLCGDSAVVVFPTGPIYSATPLRESNR